MLLRPDFTKKAQADSRAEAGWVLPGQEGKARVARRELGFRGLIVSDDLTIGALIAGHAFLVLANLGADPIRKVEEVIADQEDVGAGQITDRPAWDSGRPGRG